MAKHLNYNRLNQRAEKGELERMEQMNWELKYNTQLALRDGIIRYVYIGGERYTITPENSDLIAMILADYLDSLETGDTEQEGGEDGDSDEGYTSIAWFNASTGILYV